MEQGGMWMVWLLRGKPGGGTRGIASCYPNSTLFNGRKPSSKATGFFWAGFSPYPLPRVAQSHVVSHPTRFALSSSGSPLPSLFQTQATPAARPVAHRWVHWCECPILEAFFRQSSCEIAWNPLRVRYLVAHWGLKSPFNGILTPWRCTQQYSLAFFVSILLLSAGELEISAVCFSR